MGVNMGLLPTKGLTLPLMSYGGGSMMIMCCAVALLFRVHSEIAELNAMALNKGKGMRIQYG
jgi:cell division protein FtsW